MLSALLVRARTKLRENGHAIATPERASGFQIRDNRIRTIPSVATFHTMERSKKTPAAYKAR